MCRDGAGAVAIWAPPLVPDETNPTLAEEVTAVVAGGSAGRTGGPRCSSGAAMVREAAAGPPRERIHCGRSRR